MLNWYKWTHVDEPSRLRCKTGKTIWWYLFMVKPIRGQQDKEKTSKTNSYSSKTSAKSLKGTSKEPPYASSSSSSCWSSSSTLLNYASRVFSLEPWDGYASVCSHALHRCCEVHTILYCVYHQTRHNSHYNICTLYFTSPAINPGLQNTALVVPHVEVRGTVQVSALSSVTILYYIPYTR